MKYISIIYYVNPRMREKEKGDSRQTNVKLNIFRKIFTYTFKKLRHFQEGEIHRCSQLYMHIK